MLDQVLSWFQVTPDYDLDLMLPNQILADYASRALVAVTDVLVRVRPDVVLVQGDTTTVMMTALSAFYQRIPLGHVEAGLRTRDPYDPFPEEINRRVTAVLATHHFAPTARAAAALRSEQVPEGRIHLTGNTVVDALQMTMRQPVHVDLGFEANGKRLILVTAHRRESFGAPLESVCMAIRDVAERNPDVDIVYPVHRNPNVCEPVYRLLAGQPHVHLLGPMRYEQFVHLLARSYLVLTDSGGVQEEAPVLGKPTLVLRETTERPEAVEGGVRPGGGHRQDPHSGRSGAIAT
jgi:UDP-N-acetylglucosamine 2-epimerase (non-hydrolysing)